MATYKLERAHRPGQSAPVIVIELPDDVFNFLENGKSASNSMALRFNKNPMVYYLYLLINLSDSFPFQDCEFTVNEKTFECALKEESDHPKPLVYKSVGNNTLRNIPTKIFAISSNFVPIDRFVFDSPVKPLPEISKQPESSNQTTNISLAQKIVNTPKKPLPQTKREIPFKTTINQTQIQPQLSHSSTQSLQNSEKLHQTITSKTEQQSQKFEPTSTTTVKVESPIPIQIQTETAQKSIYIPNNTNLPATNQLLNQSETELKSEVSEVNPTALTTPKARRNSKKIDLTLREQLLKFLAPQPLNLTQLRAKLKNVNDDEMYEELNSLATMCDGVYTLRATSYTEVSMSWPFTKPDKPKVAANKHDALISLGKSESDLEVMELLPLLPIMMPRKPKRGSVSASSETNSVDDDEKKNSIGVQETESSQINGNRQDQRDALE
ncbi:hypothetical protein HK096_003273, partial [Nowakowskiella sp. JEL0078]